MNLPHAFQERMKERLGSEYESFAASYEEARQQGLRINELKITAQEFLEKSDWELTPVPWTNNGFYYSEGFRPAKHPYYHAGLYYIQEPSAMSPAAVLAPLPGEKVLDLCAAPGGKTTQLASFMKGSGVLVTNDNNPNRVKALVKNVELYGLTNAIVTNETPDRLAAVFPGYFDRILVDAPCSGEGMFRKEPDMVKVWSEQAIQTCCGMQRPILHDAAVMLRPGGLLLYSTCTFAPEENEQMIADFLNKHPDFAVLDMPLYEGWQHGRPDWTSEPASNEQVWHTVRLWPHHIRGEGHFLALLHKKETAAAQPPKTIDSPRTNNKELTDFYAFVNEVLPGWKGLEDPNSRLTFHDDRVFLSPVQAPGLQSLRIARQGWLLGTIKKKRFEPSQAFAMGLKSEDAAHVVNFAADDENVIRYLKGETILRKIDRGWNLVCVDGFPIGWAKGTDNMMKNVYPAGWRWMDSAGS